MRKPFLTILIFLQLFSCTPDAPPVVLELTKVIESDFQNIPTASRLLPIKIKEAFTFEEHNKKLIATDSSKKKLMPPPPLPGGSKVICEINAEPFRQLIQHELISKVEYNNLLLAAKRIENKGLVMASSQVVDKSAAKVLTEKSLDTFQNFACPIMTDKHLIIYRNIYQSIIKGPSMVGNGTFFIYEKKNEKWILIHRVTTWIS